MLPSFVSLSASGTRAGNIAGTRHNAGFLVVDELARRAAVGIPF